jgi:hypothetical protein
LAFDIALFVFCYRQYFSVLDCMLPPHRPKPSIGNLN